MEFLTIKIHVIRSKQSSRMIYKQLIDASIVGNSIDITTYIVIGS